MSGDLDAVAEMRAAFDRRGRVMHELLAAIPGVTCLEPQGAFYCFPSFEGVLGRELAGRTPDHDAGAVRAAPRRGPGRDRARARRSARPATPGCVRARRRRPGRGRRAHRQVPRSRAVRVRTRTSAGRTSGRPGAASSLGPMKRVLVTEQLAESGLEAMRGRRARGRRAARPRSRGAARRGARARRRW